MNKTSQGSIFGTNLAIVIYYFLPRIHVSTHSHLWNLFFNLRGFSVFLITVFMMLITYQKMHGNKWKNINLGRMVVGSYILYIFATLFYLMMLEFI
jgi:hypothetical protein